MKQDVNFEKEVRLFMIFDVLGDTERTGPLLWKINRKRLEDVKNHVMDLMFIIRILRKHLPNFLDYDLIYDYIICHDLPEAITGDITKFEGVSEDEIMHVTAIAIDYLSEEFNDIIGFKRLLNSYKNRIDIESKVVNMIDKLHSATTFIKYESEKHVDMDNPDIIPSLRKHPFVINKMAEGKDLSEIFFEFHYKALDISDEECEKYQISRKDANIIVDTIRSFADEIFHKKQRGTLLVDAKDFPKDATKYNRKINPTP